MLYYKSIPRKFSYSPIFYFQIFKQQNIASSSCEFWYFAAASLYSWEASGNRYRDKERVLLLKYWMSLPNDLRQCYAWSIFYANAAAELHKAVSFNLWCLSISGLHTLLLDRWSIDLSGAHEKEGHFHYKNFLRALKWGITCHTCSSIPKSLYWGLGLSLIHSNGIFGCWSRYGM